MFRMGLWEGILVKSSIHERGLLLTVLGKENYGDNYEN